MYQLLGHTLLLAIVKIQTNVELDVEFKNKKLPIQNLNHKNKLMIQNSGNRAKTDKHTSIIT